MLSLYSKSILFYKSQITNLINLQRIVEIIKKFNFFIFNTIL
jgi:hypothetical protein